MLSRSFLLLIILCSVLGIFNFLTAKQVFAASCARDSDCPNQPDQTASCVISYDGSGNAISGECVYSTATTTPASASCKGNLAPCEPGVGSCCSGLECLHAPLAEGYLCQRPDSPFLPVTSTPAPRGPSGAGTPCNPDQPGHLLTAIGCVPTEPSAFILAVSRLLSGAGGGIALLLMIAGAFRMITSGGNPDAVKAGSEQFTSALIGLLFIIFATLLLKVIGVDVLSIPGFGST